MIDEGKKAPAFSALDTDGEKRSLKDYKGKKLVLYFYPKDLTPGCTIEANGFSKLVNDFAKQNCEVLGVSLDSVARHKKFTEKHCLAFPLLADEDTKVSSKYGVYQLKKFMGREYMGIVRTTYVIDENGKVAKRYDKVKPLGHAKDVLAFVKEM